MRTLIILLLVSQSIFAQKYFTRTGFTGFKASVDAFEPVQAINKSTSVILTNDGKIAAQLFISAFKFRVSLMQEHFNENFMDSYEYPKATFKGKIDDFDSSNLTSKDVTIKGVLTVKGKEKNITTTGRVSKNGETIRLNSSFSVLAKDFDIKIPSVVRRKIARQINITLNYELIEKK